MEKSAAERLRPNTEQLNTNSISSCGLDAGSRTDNSPIEQQRVWAEPRKSRASRRPPLHSHTSIRGFHVNHSTNIEIVFESALEGDLSQILMTDPRVIVIYDQPPAVGYIDANGKPRAHTFDFLVTVLGGTRVAIAVKPDAKVASSGIRETLLRIQKSSPGFADEFVVRTERHITPARIHNARLIIRARRGRVDADVAQMRTRVASLRGAASIESLIEGPMSRAAGLMAVACLIGEGVLAVTDGERISAKCHVRRGMNHPVPTA